MATAKIIFHSGGNLGDPPPSRITARPLSTEKEEFFKPSGSTPPPPSGQALLDLTPFALNVWSFGKHFFSELIFLITNFRCNQSGLAWMVERARQLWSIHLGE